MMGDNGGRERHKQDESAAGTVLGKKFFLCGMIHDYPRQFCLKLFRGAKCKKIVTQTWFLEKKLPRSFRYNWLLGRFLIQNVGKNILTHLNFLKPCILQRITMRLELAGESTLCRGKAIQSCFRILSRGVLQHVSCSFVWYRNPIKGWLCCRVPFTSYWRSLSASLSKITILHSAGCAFLRASFVCHCATTEVAENALSRERIFCKSSEPDLSKHQDKVHTALGHIAFNQC